MRKFQQKREWRDILQSKPVLILLGFIIIAFTWNVYGLLTRMQETVKNRKIEEDKITGLRERKDKLTADINNLKTENGVEENIRDKFGLVKDGEGMVVVVDDKDQANAVKAAQSSGFWSFLKNLFK